MGTRRIRSSSAKYRKGKEAKYADKLTTDDDDEEGRDVKSDWETKSWKGFVSDQDVSSGYWSSSNAAGGAHSRADQGDLPVSMTGNTRHPGGGGGAFCALTSTMWPTDVAPLDDEHLASATSGQLRQLYDEFGFRIDSEDMCENNDENRSRFDEDSQHKLKWIAHLEFTHQQVVGELTWDKVDPQLAKTDKLHDMLKKQGVPHSLRPFVWSRLCGAVLKRKRAAFSYQQLLKAAKNDRPSIAKQIEKDLLRTLPSNVCFATQRSVGIPRLRRILRAVAYLYPDIGYCQGTGMVVGTMLLFMEEEDVFWLVITVIEDILPASYFSQSLVGVQADQRVFRQLIASTLPRLDHLLKEHDIELALISLHWFLTLFSSVLNVRVLLRVWDLFLFEGSVNLFRIALGMLKMKEGDLIALTNAADIFNMLSNIPSSIDNADLLIDFAEQVAGDLTENSVVSARKKHLAYLMADQGLSVVSNPETAAALNLPKQKVSRRHLKRSQSLVSQILRRKRSSSSAPGSVYGDLDDMDREEDSRLKNVRQTELLVDLKEAVLKITRHFVTTDPQGHQDIILQADYSLESHTHDQDNYVSVQRHRRKRARALLDFERRDDDELGFKRHDVITVLSMRDEHCWVGELHGRRGWFPAKFVELLDERSKLYTALGDDTVNETVTDLVRGDLCAALKTLFEQGMKRQSVLYGACHPWIFIEEVANEEVKKDFKSVYSRLVLCKTFRLDEDGKVLTPEELLYKSVQQVNMTHDQSKTQMDVKFRSLVCLGLNEQVLHLWWEVLSSNQRLVTKYYQPWSFVRSPGWVQIKCELRLLAQFALSLSLDWELPQKARYALDKPLREGVRDMLVKHHLFSWDL